MASAMLATTFQQNRGPMKLYVGSLHFNITEDMLRDIFEPFGKVSDRESNLKSYLTSVFFCYRSTVFNYSKIQKRIALEDMALSR